MLQKLPKTVDEAVESLMSTLKPEALTLIKKLKEEDLYKCHHGLGKSIRNDFRLLGKENDALKKSAGYDNPDDVSEVIIEALWDKLQEI
jgi:hypothetical protein